MRRLLLVTVAAISLGCGHAVGQVPSGPAGNPPAPRTSAMTLPRASLPRATSPSMAAPGSTSGGNQLGSAQFNLGVVSAPPGSPAIGTITACPANALAAPAPTPALNPNSATANGMSFTPAAITPFGTSILSGLCAQAATNGALNAGTGPAPGAVSPLPDPGTITGSIYGDSTIPLEATEQSGPGMSPLIAVPDPNGSASPCGSSTGTGTSTSGTPLGGMGSAGPPAASSPLGC